MIQQKQQDSERKNERKNSLSFDLKDDPKVLKWILGMSLLGFLLAIGAIWGVSCLCLGPKFDPNGHGICNMVVKTPPWTSLTALATIPVLLLTWYLRTIHKRQDIRNAQQEQITERFIRAVELLGNKTEGVQIGAVYALERVSKDSERDRWQITETLSGFVRVVASVFTNQQEGSKDGQSPTVDDQGRRVKMVVQAALTVLGRRPLVDEPRGINLQNTDLRMADLSGSETRFDRVDLSGANLESANLEKANFSEAILSGAILRKAILRGANLKGAIIKDMANLEEVIADGAHFDNAEFKWPKLKGASFVGTFFNGVDLRTVDWSEADLEFAKLVGAKYDRNTRFPDGLNPKSMGAVEVEETELLGVPVSPEGIVVSVGTESATIETEDREGLDTSILPGVEAKIMCAPSNGVEKPEKSILSILLAEDGVPLLQEWNAWKLVEGIAPAISEIVSPGGTKGIRIESVGRYAVDRQIEFVRNPGTIKFATSADLAPSCYAKLNVNLITPNVNIPKEFWLQVVFGLGQIEMDRIFKNEIKVTLPPMAIDDGWTELSICPEDCLRRFLPPWSIQQIDVVGFRLRESGGIYKISVLAPPVVDERTVVKDVLQQIWNRPVLDSLDEIMMNAYVQKLRGVGGQVRELVRLIAKEIPTWDQLQGREDFKELARSFYRRLLAREHENEEVLLKRANRLRDEFKVTGRLDRNVDDFVDSPEYWQRFGREKVPVVTPEVIVRESWKKGRKV